jgi:hypothetical protein
MTLLGLWLIGYFFTAGYISKNDDLENILFIISLFFVWPFYLGYYLGVKNEERKEL